MVGSVVAQAVFMVFKALSWQCLPEQAGLNVVLEPDTAF